MQKTVYSIKYIVKNSIEYRVKKRKERKEKKCEKKGTGYFLLLRVSCPLLLMVLFNFTQFYLHPREFFLNLGEA